MNPKDLKIIQKVANDASKFEWHLLQADDKYYKAIEFPVEAERRIESFYSEVSKGLTIIVGAYSSRFYYEEDKYTWDKKTYAVIVSTKNFNTTAIAFITNEDVEKWNRKDTLLSFAHWGKEEPEENAVEELYDYVNRKVNGIDELYSEFLDEE